MLFNITCLNNNYQFISMDDVDIIVKSFNELYYNRKK